MASRFLVYGSCIDDDRVCSRCWRTGAWHPRAPSPIPPFHTGGATFLPRQSYQPNSHRELPCKTTLTVGVSVFREMLGFGLAYPALDPWPLARLQHACMCVYVCMCLCGRAKATLVQARRLLDIETSGLIGLRRVLSGDVMPTETKAFFLSILEQ
ncbi:hypothetical protein LY78DRAFT_353447 [Colletotrichum sublineola]|nr:hypothetical protein LY78DRAFT_353447 [Colletotrichum sublineola]